MLRILNGITNLEGPRRKDALFMPRLAGPGQRVAASADVAIVLVEGYPQRLHGLRMVVMVIVVIVVILVVSVKVQRPLCHGEGVGQGEGHGAGRGPVVGRGGAQLGRPQADVDGLVGGGEGGVGAQRVDVHLGHLIHAAAAARCQTTSCWRRLV